MPEGEVGTSLPQEALETLEFLHERQAQRGLTLFWAGPGCRVESPLGLGEGLVQDMLGVGQAGEGGPQERQLGVKVLRVANPESSEKKRRSNAFLDLKGMVRKEMRITGGLVVLIV